MNNYLSNTQLKKYICEKGILTGESSFIEWHFDIYFEVAVSNKLPGRYIFSDRKGYHVEDVGDRGGIVYRRTYKNINELTYDIYKNMTWTCAYEYSEHHKFNYIDKKELLISYQLELMKRIDQEYYNRLLNEN